MGTRFKNLENPIMKSRFLVPFLALAGIAATGTAMAQSPEYRAPWRGDFWGSGYFGIGAGESKFDRNCGNTNVFSCDQRDTAWKVYAGGAMNDVLGLEIGYTDFGTIQAQGGQTKAWAVPITLTAGLPLGPVRVYGKAGGLYGRTDVNAAPSTLFDTGHKSGWGWTYGAGAWFHVTPTIAVRADWDRYKMDFAGGRDDVDMISAGVQFRF
jgi:opacity protein-like surface antigen